MGVIAEIADRVMVMYGGRVVERGTKRDLFLNPQHPYTRALLDSIPPLEGERPRRLRSIPGSPPSLFDRSRAAPSRRAAPCGLKNARQSRTLSAQRTPPPVFWR